MKKPARLVAIQTLSEGNDLNYQTYLTAKAVVKPNVPKPKVDPTIPGEVMVVDFVTTPAVLLLVVEVVFEFE